MSSRSEPKLGEAAAELIDSALKLSASVAQTVAEATTGKPQEDHPEDTHLQAIMRHGTTAAGSLLTTVIAAARSTAPNGASPAKAPPSAPALVAEPGQSLRVPLSVDNPGTDTMTGIEPRLAESDPVLPFDVAFSPESLTIEPKDFEKLNVLIDIHADAAPGLYRLSFTLTGQEDQPITLPVEVRVPAENTD